MRIHSETAWNIASLFSDVLASSTRDLAAHIDIAISAAVAAEREACAKIADGELMEVATGAEQRIVESIASAIRARAQKGE